MQSPQFVTAIQAQSLYVADHFIHDLDADDALIRQRVIKRSLPDWFCGCSEGRDDSPIQGLYRRIELAAAIRPYYER